MRQTETRKVVAILKARKCVQGATVGSHVKWTAPAGHATSITTHRTTSPGVLRNIQRDLAPEFGPKWLEEDLSR